MPNQLRIERSMLKILIYIKFATDKNAFKMSIIICYNQILFECIISLCRASNEMDGTANVLLYLSK